MSIDTDDIVAIIIRNQTGEFFLHQRSANKKVYPNLYGPGAGGHIAQGESVDAAARRELFEETGVAAQPLALFTMDFSATHGDYRLHLYEVTTEDVPRPEASEWQKWGWYTTDQLKDLVAEGEVMPDSMSFLRRYFVLKNL